MRYVCLVSHGDLANGLCDTLSMFAGNCDAVKCSTLGKGENVEQFSARCLDMLEKLQADDELIVLADLIGGSPLTTFLNCMNNANKKPVIVLGGMNLAMALNALLMKDQDVEIIRQACLSEASDAVKEFVLDSNEEDDI